MGSVLDNFPFSWITHIRDDRENKIMESKKIIFLDVDGVLNNEETAYKTGNVIDENMVGILKHIVDETGAEIILSSSWRRDYCFFLADGLQSKDPDIKKLYNALEKVELSIGGITPLSNESGPSARPLEIREWLNCFHNIFSYVILDDDTFWSWGFLQRNVVTTKTFHLDERSRHKYVTGLTMEHAEKAISILNDEGAMKYIG